MPRPDLGHGVTPDIPVAHANRSSTPCGHGTDAKRNFYREARGDHSASDCGFSTRNCNRHGLPRCTMKPQPSSSRSTRMGGQKTDRSGRGSVAALRVLTGGDTSEKPASIARRPPRRRRERDVGRTVVRLLVRHRAVTVHCVRAARRAPPTHAIRRSRAAASIAPTRALCGIQPAA